MHLTLKIRRAKRGYKKKGYMSKIYFSLLPTQPIIVPFYNVVAIILRIRTLMSLPLSRSFS